MSEQPFSAGQIFFRPGDPGDRAFLILEGMVEISTGTGTKTRLLGTYGPGDVFGEMSLIGERPHVAQARAKTEGRYSSLTQAEFDQLILTDPARCTQYLRSLFERLRAVMAAVPPGPTSALVETRPLVVPEVIETVEAEIVETVEGTALGGPYAFPMPDGSAPPAVRIVIYPLTRAAAKTLPEEGLLVTKFPFRIGRTAQDKEADGLDLNDLWLLDERPYNVSRNHCAIDMTRHGPCIRDRGSHLGCQVNETRIGGHSRLALAELQPGQNVLVIGSTMSPYQFRITVDPER